MPVIEVKDLGKKYKRYKNRRHRLAEWLTGREDRHEAQWVLRGVGFAVERGETVGVIGENGAGKSTLLKILSGVTAPSEGSYRLEGAVSSLLELGAGFHPDFSGRQNALLSARLTGYSGKQSDAMIAEISAFAEIGDYLDQPLRTYSSGMVVRLAFATATAARPGVLLVDEALAVGDTYFQHKCFARLRRFREEGTTILFVSHDPGAVKSLCDRAILLARGKLVKEARPEEVLDYYNATIARREADYRLRQYRGAGTRMVTRSGNGTAEISAAALLQNGEEIHAAQVGEAIEVVVEVRFLRATDNPTIGFKLKDRLGNAVYGTNTYHLGCKTGSFLPGESLQVIFSLPLHLGPGDYSLTVAAHRGATHLEENYDWWDRAWTLQVVPGQQALFSGTAYIPGVTVRTTRNIEAAVCTERSL